jgi:4-hydroxybenzoate polyprenyltransferase
MILINALRVRHWIKNLLVFAPLFFSKNFFNHDLLIKTIIVFFSFSLIASSIYCINDILDLKDDQKHPEKCKRPLAAGKISVIHVFMLAFLCFILSFFLPIIFNLDKSTLFIIFIYFTVNILYSKWLKKISLIDIFIISLGFVLRVIVGGFATGVILSHWIIILSFILALFLAITKRLNDIHLNQSSGIKIRKASSNYSTEYLHVLLAITGSISIVVYIMYTLSDEVIKQFDSKNIYISTIFVLIVLFEFLNTAIIKKESGNPTETFLKNRLIQITTFFWLLFFYLIAYLPN